MFKVSGNRMVQRFPLPERDFDLNKLQDANTSPDDGYWNANRSKREHMSVNALMGPKENPSFDKAMQYMLSKALLDPATTPLDLASPISGFGLVGEYLFISRPLIYSNF